MLERKTNECVPFLDLHVKRIDHGKLEIGVFRKPTHMHTDKYLPYDSHHPIRHNASISRSLFLTAQGISSSYNSRESKQKRVLIRRI